MQGEEGAMKPGRELLHAIIPGKPSHKERPRARVMMTAKGPQASIYTPAKTLKAEASAAVVVCAAHSGAEIDQPVAVAIEAVFARPQRLLRKKDPARRLPHDGKPDWDNIAKLYCDALVKRTKKPHPHPGVLRDDSLICWAFAKCYYAAKGEEPHVAIWLSEMDGRDAR